MDYFDDRMGDGPGNAHPYFGECKEVLQTDGTQSFSGVSFPLIDKAAKTLGRIRISKQFSLRLQSINSDCQIAKDPFKSVFDTVAGILDCQGDAETRPRKKCSAMKGV